jgi:hypothetical protein
VASAKNKSDTTIIVQYSFGNTAYRNYLARERLWVMEFMPEMPEDQWKRYLEWVNSALDPLPLKFK